VLADVAVPWWQWALFVPGGIGLSALHWWAYRKPAGKDSPYRFNGPVYVVVAVVVGPALALFGLMATLWALTS
jgi:hypothetical protein